MPQDEKFYTVLEISHICRCTSENVRRWMARGRLPYTRVGRARVGWKSSYINMSSHSDLVSFFTREGMSESLDILINGFGDR